MKKFYLLLMSLFLSVGAMAQTFVEPQVGRFYKIQGKGKLPWVKASTNDAGSVQVSANEADAAVFEKTTNGFKAVSTGKYLGYKDGKYTYSETELTVELLNTGDQANNEGMYAIKSGNNYMFNNNNDGIVHESSGWLDIERLWGFIEVPNPSFVVGDGIYTIQADENGKRGFLAASSEYTRPVLTKISWSDYAGNSCSSIVENGTYWYVKNINGVTYLYNIGKGMFIYDDNSDNISFGNPFGLNFTKHNNYIHVGSGDGIRYLSMGCGTTAPNQVKWEKGNANDGGCLLTFNFVSNGATTYAEQIAAADAKIAGLIESWKAAKLAWIGYVGGYPESAREQIESINSFDGMTDFEQNASILELSTDKYYRLVCVSPKTDNGGDTSYKTLAFDGSSNLVTSPADNSNINQIFKFESAGNNTFYLKNMNADGYLNKIQAGSYRAKIVAESSACKLDLTHFGNAQWKLHNSESNDAKHCLFAENHPTENVSYACSGWDNGANSASAWYIIEAKDVEITINEYATVYLPFAVETTEDATVYAIESTNSTYATLTEKSDIPANKGAILAGSGKVTLNIINDAESNWDANMLKGTTYNQNVTPDGVGYVLSKPEGATEVGFYIATTEGLAEGTFRNNANKAYLEVSNSNGAPAYSIRFDFGGTTAVEDVETECEVEVIFDLQGRRVNEITAGGIYIINGKKVLVK